MYKRAVFLISMTSVTVLGVAGCAVELSPQQVIINRVKDNNDKAEWFDHVTRWNAAVIADFVVQTDYSTDSPKDYAQAVAICQAFVAEIDPESEESLLIRVEGIRVKTRTEVDGSKTSREDDKMMAQMSDIQEGRKCGAVPPSGPVEDRVQELGIPLY